MSMDRQQRVIDGNYSPAGGYESNTSHVVLTLNEKQALECIEALPRLYQEEFKKVIKDLAFQTGTTFATIIDAFTEFCKGPYYSLDTNKMYDCYLQLQKNFETSLNHLCSNEPMSLYSRPAHEVERVSFLDIHSNLDSLHLSSKSLIRKLEEALQGATHARNAQVRTRDTSPPKVGEFDLKSHGELPLTFNQRQMMQTADHQGNIGSLGLNREALTTINGILGVTIDARHGSRLVETNYSQRIISEVRYGRAVQASSSTDSKYDQNVVAFSTQLGPDGGDNLNTERSGQVQHANADVKASSTAAEGSHSSNVESIFRPINQLASRRSNQETVRDTSLQRQLNSIIAQEAASGRKEIARDREGASGGLVYKESASRSHNKIANMHNSLADKMYEEEHRHKVIRNDKHVTIGGLVTDRNTTSNYNYPGSPSSDSFYRKKQELVDKIKMTITLSVPPINEEHILPSGVPEDVYRDALIRYLSTQGTQTEEQIRRRNRKGSSNMHRLAEAHRFSSSSQQTIEQHMGGAHSMSMQQDSGHQSICASPHELARLTTTQLTIKFLEIQKLSLNTENLLLRESIKKLAKALSHSRHSRHALLGDHYLNSPDSDDEAEELLLSQMDMIDCVNKLVEKVNRLYRRKEEAEKLAYEQRTTIEGYRSGTVKETSRYKQLDFEIAELNEMLAKHKADLEEKRQEISDLKSALSRSKTDCTYYQKHCETLQNSVKSLTQRYKDQQAISKNLVAGFENYRGMYDRKLEDQGAIRNHSIQLETDVEILTSRLKASFEESSKLKAELDQARIDIHTATDEFHELIEQREAEIDALILEKDAQMKAIKQDRSRLHVELESLKRSLKDAQESLEDLKKEKDKEVKKAHSFEQDYKSRFDSVKSELVIKEVSLTEYVYKVGALEKELIEVRNSYQALSEEVQAKNRELIRLKTTIDSNKRNEQRLRKDLNRNRSTSAKRQKDKEANPNEGAQPVTSQRDAEKKPQAPPTNQTMPYKLLVSSPASQSVLHKDSNRSPKGLPAQNPDNKQAGPFPSQRKQSYLVSQTKTQVFNSETPSEVKVLKDQISMLTVELTKTKAELDTIKVSSSNTKPQPSPFNDESPIPKAPQGFSKGSLRNIPDFDSSKMQKQLIDKEREVERLESELKVANKECQTNRQTIRELQEKLNVIDVLKKQNQTLVVEIQNIAKSAEETTTKLNQLITENTTLRKTLTETELALTAIKKAQEQNAASSSRTKETNTFVKEVLETTSQHIIKSSDKSSAREEVENIKNSSRSNVSELLAERDTSRQTISELNSQMVIVKRELEITKKELDSTKKVLQQTEKQLSISENNCKGLTERIQMQESEISSIQIQVSKVVKEAENLKMTCKSYENTINTYSKENDSLKKRVKETEETITHFTSNTYEKEDYLNQLTQEISTLKAENKRQTDELQKTVAQLKNYQLTIKSKETELAQSREEFKDQEDSIQTLQAKQKAQEKIVESQINEIVQLKSVLNTKDTEIYHNTTQIKKQEETITVLQQQISDLKTQIDSLKQGQQLDVKCLEDVVITMKDNSRKQKEELNFEIDDLKDLVESKMQFTFARSSFAKDDSAHSFGSGNKSERVSNRKISVEKDLRVLKLQAENDDFKQHIRELREQMEYDEKYFSEKKAELQDIIEKHKHTIDSISEDALLKIKEKDQLIESLEKIKQIHETQCAKDIIIERSETKELLERAKVLEQSEEKYKQEISDYNFTVQYLEGILKQRDETIEQLKVHLNQIESQGVETSSEDRTNYERKIKELETTIQQIEADIIKERAEKVKLRNELASVQNQQREYIEKETIHRTETIMVEEKVHEENKQITSSKKNERQLLDSDFFKNEINRLGIEITSRDTLVASLNEQIAYLTSQLHSMDSVIQKDKIEKTSQNSKIENFNKERVQLKEEIENLRNDVHNLTNQLEEANTALTEKRKEKVVAVACGHAPIIQKLEEKLSTCTSELKTAKENLSQVQQELTDERNKKKKCGHEKLLEKLEADSNTLESTLKNKSAELDKMYIENEKLRRELLGDKKYEATIRELESVLNKSTVELDHRDNTISELEGQIHHLEEEIETTRKELEAERKKKSQPGSNCGHERLIKKLEGTIQEERDTNTGLTEQINSLNNELQTVNNLLSEAEKQIKKLKTSTQQQTSSESGSKRVIEKVVKEKETLETELRQEIYELNRELERTKILLVETEKKKVQVQTVACGHDRVIKKLEDQLEQMRAEQQPNKEKIQALNSEVSELKFQIEAEKKKKVAPVVQAQACNHEKHIKQLQEQLETERTTKNELTTEHKKATKDIERITKDLERAKKDIESYEPDRVAKRELQAEVKKLTRDIEKMNATHEKLFKQKTDMFENEKAQRTELQAEVKRLGKEFDKQTRELDKAKREVEQLENEKSLRIEVQNELKTAQKEIERINRENEKAKREIEIEKGKIENNLLQTQQVLNDEISRSTQLQEENQTLQEQITSLTIEIDNISKELDLERAKPSNVQNEPCNHEETIAELTDLQAQEREATRTIQIQKDKLQNELVKAQAKLDKLTKEYENEKKKNSCSEKKSSCNHQQIIDQLSEEIQSEKSLNEELNEHIRQLLAEIDEHKAELERYKTLPMLKSDRKITTNTKITKEIIIDNQRLAEVEKELIIEKQNSLEYKHRCEALLKEIELLRSGASGPKAAASEREIGKRKQRNSVPIQGRKDQKLTNSDIFKQEEEEEENNLERHIEVTQERLVEERKERTRMQIQVDNLANEMQEVTSAIAENKSRYSEGGNLSARNPRKSMASENGQLNEERLKHLNELLEIEKQARNHLQVQVDQLNAELLAVRRELEVPAEENERPQDEVQTSAEIEELRNQIEILTSDLEIARAELEDATTKLFDKDRIIVQLKAKQGKSTPPKLSAVQSEVSIENSTSENKLRYQESLTSQLEAENQRLRRRVEELEQEITDLREQFEQATNEKDTYIENLTRAIHEKDEIIEENFLKISQMENAENATNHNQEQNRDQTSENENTNSSNQKVKRKSFLFYLPQTPLQVVDETQSEDTELTKSKDKQTEVKIRERERITESRQTEVNEEIEHIEETYHEEVEHNSNFVESEAYSRPSNSNNNDLKSSSKGSVNNSSQKNNSGLNVPKEVPVFSSYKEENTSQIQETEEAVHEDKVEEQIQEPKTAPQPQPVKKKASKILQLLKYAD